MATGGYAVNWFRVLFLVLLVFAQACSLKSPPDPIIPIVNDDQELVKKQASLEELSQKLMGSQFLRQPAKLNKDYQVLETQEGVRYFLKNNKVVSSIRNATHAEKKLIYWRYHFRGHAYTEEPVVEPHLTAHTQKWIKLKCDDLKMGVLYDPSMDQVVKVFYYAL